MSSATLPLAEAPKLTLKDFQSDQEVRWCPGCGDYAILRQVQKLLADAGVRPEQQVFVSGIGCSSRFPYYMNTYGFHTIHGRAPAIATGLKVMRPDLNVWVITGDGDALSIGGNHFIHALRRNVGFKVLLFNNRIYGLTKGQYSPTSEVGKQTASTPLGSPDTPLNPISLALGAEASFVARTVDRDLAHMTATLQRAVEHKGTALVEVLQNCNVYNDGAWEKFTDKSSKPDTTLFMEPGKPLLFGGKTRGLRLNRLSLEVVEVAKGEEEREDLLRSDPKDLALAQLLARATGDELPLPVGVFYDSERTPFESALTAQRLQAEKKQPGGDLDAFLRQGDTWVVDA